MSAYFAAGAVLTRKTLYATKQKRAKAAREALLTRRCNAFTREQSSVNPGPHFEADDADDSAEKSFPDTHILAVDLGVTGQGRAQEGLVIRNRRLDAHDVSVRLGLRHRCNFRHRAD